MRIHCKHSKYHASKCHKGERLLSECILSFHTHTHIHTQEQNEISHTTRNVDCNKIKVEGSSLVTHT